MVDLSQLKVSLTKNGYFKIAELLRVYSRWQVLEHVEGHHEGIDIKPSQIKNMLDQNTATGEIPEFWDSIKGYGDKALDAFTVVAMLFSHHKLITLFREASQDRPEFTGYFYRRDLKNKEYTNLAFALGCFGLSDYRPGAGAVEFDLRPVVYHLRVAHGLVTDLLRSKLQRAGWIDPSRNALSPDRELMAELEAQQFHRVLSMSWPRFSAWLDGRFEMEQAVTRFGLHDVGLFRTPIPAHEQQS